MRLAAVLAAALAAAGLGCSGSDPAAEVPHVLMEHFRAVQAGDLDALAGLVEDCRTESVAAEASAQAAACRDRLAQALASVEAQRALGAYRFDDPWGLGLARALVLGAGGWWQLESLEETSPGRFEAVLLVRTHYRREETRGLPPDAVVEYLVKPLGTVRRMPRRAEGPGALREQLVELRLRAVLSRRPEGWRVVSIEPLPETAVYETVSWRPL